MVRYFYGIIGAWKYIHTKKPDGSNGSGHRAWERVEWVVCHFDYEHLPQELLLAIYKFIELEL